MRPYVGFHPTTLQSAAGWRTEPPVSVPIASGTASAPTAAADPPDEPPGTRSGSHGLRAILYPEFSFDEPIPNSSQFVLPTTTAPARTSRSTQVAPSGATNPARIFEPAVDGR